MNLFLSNFASLLDINPRQLTTWFHEAFIDAYDWVVEPNVLGMGTYSLGSAMMTKPYVSGTPYINKMSDYCKSCKFNPKKDCPVSNLYWAFLDRHRDSFEGNIRMAMPIRNLAKRSEEKSRFVRSSDSFKTRRAGFSDRETSKDKRSNKIISLDKNESIT